MKNILSLIQDINREIDILSSGNLTVSSVVSHPLPRERA